MRRLGQGEPAHQAHDAAAQEVDGGDHQAGHGVAAHELGGAVHGAVELALPHELRAARARLLAVDHAGAQVGVDRHLLAGQAVQGEARRHLGDAAGALGDHDELHDEQDAEDDDADHQVAAHDEVAEGVDHLAGVALEQDEARRGDVEAEAEQGEEEQQGGEGGEVARRRGGEHGEEHEQREGDVAGEEDVEEARGDRQDEQGEHQADGQDEGHLAARRAPCCRSRAGHALLPTRLRVFMMAASTSATAW
ncbi:MAG: hypothetical protein HY812_10745 [Planctomycetes bacterium]|nr:hypothetical protein [Planctomycetota bacterium]